MTAQISPTPADIRAYRAENAKLRERDIAANLGISEAALVAAEVGLTATRIDSHPNRLLERVKELGEVMALTRNESAVHEKIGEFETIKIADHVSLTLGENMDMRIFNTVWRTALPSPRRMATTSASACNISTRPAMPSSSCTCGRRRTWTPIVPSSRTCVSTTSRRTSPPRRLPAARRTIRP